MRTYEEPIVEVIEFTVEDIVAESSKPGFVGPSCFTVG